MSREHLVLVEYQPSAPINLSVTQRDLLRTLVRGLTVEPVPGSTETYRLTCGSSVGVVRVGDLTVELRPKVGIAPVLFLLSYALDPRGWRDLSTPLARDTNLAEAIVPLFTRAADAALRPGLLHGYRRREDSITTVRGRVRMAEQMRVHTGLPLPVEVVYDDFTPDILENRLLRAAVDVLGRVRLRHPTSTRALTRLHQQLRSVGRLTVDGREVPVPRWTRLNERYRPAIALARLIVSTAGIKAQAGEEDASAFVIDMNAVFERFVRVALREELHLERSTFPAGHAIRPVHLDTGRHIPLQPDLTWWAGGQCVFAGDCKYKKTTSSIPNADVYQMLAYLTALRLTEGLLVYAAGEDVTHEVNIEVAGKRIHVRTLDVAQAPDKILEDIRGLAAFMRKLRGRAFG